MKASRTICRQQGFTMTELLVALVIFAMLIAGSLSVFIMGLKIWQTTTLDITGMQEASMGLEQMLYGSSGRSGLRQASTTNTTFGSDATSWSINFCGTNSFGYSKPSGVITNQRGQVLCANVNQSSISITGNQVNIYIQVTNTYGSITRTNDLSTSVFFRN